MTKIITWNVNSVHTRLPRLIALLARHQPDLVCLQEIKATAEAFPATEVAAAGYQSVVHGQAGRNGVAVLARVPVTDVVRGFAGDPVPEQARVLSVTADGLRVVCVYVVNGKEVGAPEYELKLRWLDAFAAWLRASQRPTDPLIVAGDFNITPDDRDVYAPDVWRGRNLGLPGRSVPPRLGPAHRPGPGHRPGRGAVYLGGRRPRRAQADLR